MTQVVYVSAGAVEYTYPEKITSDDVISADTVQVSIGTWSDPSDWVSPTSDDVSDDGKTRTVKLLIGGDDAPPAGVYYVWVRLQDSAEVLPRRGGRLLVC